MQPHGSLRREGERDVRGDRAEAGEGFGAVDDDVVGHTQSADPKRSYQPLAEILEHLDLCLVLADARLEILYLAKRGRVKAATASVPQATRVTGPTLPRRMWSHRDAT